MGKNTSQIKLSEEEAVKGVDNLGRTVDSLNKIKSRLAEDSAFGKHDTTRSDYRLRGIYLYLHSLRY